MRVLDVPPTRRRWHLRLHAQISNGQQQIAGVDFFLLVMPFQHIPLGGGSHLKKGQASSGLWGICVFRCVNG